MTRLVGTPAVPPYDTHVVIALILGPEGSDYTEQELELAWRAYRARLDDRRWREYWGYKQFEEPER